MISLASILDLNALLLICAFHFYFNLKLHWVFPNPYLPIVTTRNNLWWVRVEKNIIDLAFVAYEFERSYLGLKIPHFHKTIWPTRDHLLPILLSIRYIYLENPTLVTAFSCPRKHLTSEGSSAVAMVLINPLAYSMTVWFKIFIWFNNISLLLDG